MNKLLLSVTSLTMVGSSFNALANEVDNIHYRGKSIYAYCRSDASAWCGGGYKYVSIWAAENVTHEGQGKPEKSQDGSVYVYCRGYSSWSGTINISNFQIQGGQLNSAELEGNTDVYPWLTIDLSFEGVGDLEHENYREHYWDGSTAYIYRYRGSYREASAEGSVMTSSGDNLFDDCSYKYGYISNSNNGEITIYHD